MPFHQNPYFPWKLLWKFLFKSTVLFVLVITSSYFILRGLFLNALKTQFPSIEWLPLLNLMVLVLAGAAFIIFLGLLMFVYFELLGPFGMFLGRVKDLNSARSEDDIDEQELSYEEPGEWSAMDAVIRQVRSEIKDSISGSDRNRLSLSTLLSSLQEGIVAFDKQMQPLFFNEAFLRIFGISKDRLGSSSMVEIIRDPQVISALERGVREDRAQVVQMVRSSGVGLAENIYRVTVSALRESDGPAFGIVAIFQDVTELKRLEQVRIDFVANVSHELRTPLTAVKGYTQTAIQDLSAGQNQEVKPFLEIVQKNADRLLALVNDLLELSTLDSGVALERSSLDVRRATQLVLAPLEASMRTKGIAIETHFGVSEVYADETRVHQVLLNLIQNAIQYGRENGKIRVDWSPVASGVELHVKDDGPGIEPLHQTRIFERFYRVDKARSRDKGGTGLGLSIVKHIMQAHQGQVRVESQPGRGAEFICFFPNRSGST